MLYLLAILLPPIALFGAGKPFQGLLSILLMLTIIGWIPAAIWAILVVNSRNADKRQKELLAAQAAQTAALIAAQQQAAAAAAAPGITLPTPPLAEGSAFPPPPAEPTTSER
jgi:uncharacterized membrane protein YqaE (UPF0057 family)